MTTDSSDGVRRALSEADITINVINQPKQQIERGGNSMKATLETVTGVTINRDIDTADSPMGIIRKFYEEDATAATQIFSNQKAIDQLMDGHIDEAKSAFELLSIEGDSIKADWKTALCNQPAIKEEMAHIESEGQVPTFVVSVSSIVA